MTLRPTPTSRIPDWLWTATTAGSLTAVVGYLGWAVGVPWLFASLGPTIFLQVQRPADGTGRFYNTIVGHGAAVVAAAAAVLLCGAAPLPPGSLAAARVNASIAALVFTALLQRAARAQHPPAAATALLVSLGHIALQWGDLGALAAGVVVTAVLGEGLRRLRAG